MTREENSSSRYRTPAGGPLLREAPVGTKLQMKDNSIVEIVANPGDGGWVQVRYEQPVDGAAEVGDEEWVFYTDVKDFAEDM
jgi:hypothetical protein